MARPMTRLPQNSVDDKHKPNQREDHGDNGGGVGLRCSAKYPPTRLADSLERPQGLSGSGGVGQSSDHCQNERFSLICLRADVRLWEEPVNKNRLHAVWSRNSFRETLYSLAFFMRTWNSVSLNGMGELAVWGRIRHHGDSLQSCQGRQSRRLLTTAFR